MFKSNQIPAVYRGSPAAAIAAPLSDIREAGPAQVKIMLSFPRLRRRRGVLFRARIGRDPRGREIDDGFGSCAVWMTMKCSQAKHASRLLWHSSTRYTFFVLKFRNSTFFGT